jgi:hypothetical protein
LKYFRQKIGVFLLKLQLFFEINDHNISFWENRHFFGKNWQK